MKDGIAKALRDEVCGRLRKEMTFSPLNGGSSNLSLKAEGTDGKKYVIKLQPCLRELDLQRKLREYVDLRDENHSPLVFADASQKIPGAYITVSEWVEGRSLVLEQETADLSALRRKAQQAAQTVKMLHSIPLPEFPDIRNLHDSERAPVWELLASTKTDFPYREQFFRTMKNNRDAVCSPKGIVHMDLRPDNMVFTEDSCKLIDMETMGIDHIWADFSYAVEINFPKERIFCVLFLESYFAGRIPDEFWRETRQQVLIRFLSLLRVSQKAGRPEAQYELAEKIYGDYDGFQSDQPKWMKETRKELKFEEG